LQLNIVRQAHPRDHLELGLDEVDMLLFVLDDLACDVAADVVATAFGMRNQLSI